MVSRIFPFPALRSDSIDFESARADYNAKVQRFSDSGSVSVRHIISGDNLVAQLLDNGKARFACVVCAPATMHRTLEVFSGATEKSSGDSGKPTLEAAQDIGLEDALIASPPLFRPIVVAAQEVRLKVDDGAGLNPIYSGRDVHFPEGAIIASAGWIQLGGGEEGMLILHDDPNLQKGKMVVDGDTTHGYRFIVKAASGLFREIRRGGESGKEHRHSILTHALSAGLQMLANEYGKADGDEVDDESGGWRQYANLRMLSEWLREKDEPIWDEDGFKAERAATALKPHFIPPARNDDDD